MDFWGYWIEKALNIGRSALKKFIISHAKSIKRVYKQFMSPFLVVWECWIGWCWLPTTKEGFTVIHVTIKDFWGYWIEGAHGALVALSTSVEGHSTTTRLVKYIKEIHNISFKKHEEGLSTIMSPFLVVWECWIVVDCLQSKKDLQ